MSLWPASSLLVALLTLGTSVLAAQDAAAYAQNASWWAALDAPTGGEDRATTVIGRAMPGWTRDRFGNLVARRGAGRPRRVVACTLDRAPYLVSEILDDGFLRVQSAAPAARHPLWDQFHEGQRVRLLTRRGTLPGVFAVRSVHLWRRRPADDAPASIESLWLDVGARSRADVAAMGIALLDPVEREAPPWIFGTDLMAAPDAGARASCAAVAAAAAATPARGETIFVLATQGAYSHAGLSSALTPLGTVDSLTIVDPAMVPLAVRARRDGGAVAIAPLDVRALSFPANVSIAHAAAMAPRVDHPGTLVETLRGDDIRSLFAAVASAGGVRPGAAPALPAIAPSASPPALPGSDGLSSVAGMLAALTDAYGVSAHESPVRDVLRRLLPSWARERSTTDSAGNLVLSLGPDRDTVVVIAHLDEIGFEVTAISSNGVVALRSRGGFFPSLWEGQPALLHSAGSVLRGIFLPRAEATTKQPEALTAWFGLDSAALVARGIRSGDAVTGEKHASRLGATRFTARSIDDRAGCTALLMAVASLQRESLHHKVIFVWSVQEETGLAGASVIAARLGPTVRRVYAVDTFVSSDSPLESHRFAFTPIGRGAVVRAVDNSSVTPAAEVDRAVTLAHSHGIPIQLGTTNGGNDGSAFSRYGAVDIPLSWPLRYSHSPAEVVDLADIAALGRLVAALVRE